MFSVLSDVPMTKA